LEPGRIEALGDAERLQLLIDGVVDYAIYLINPEGVVVSWNTGAQRLKGYDPAEIIGRPFHLFFLPEDRQRRVPEHILQSAATAGRHETEGWRVRKDGSRFWALVVVDAIRDKCGGLIGFAKITRDITDREEAARRLLDSEARYRRLVNAVIDYAIFQLDPEGIITTWNPGAERIKGYTADEVIGNHFSIFYPEEDRNAGLPRRALDTAAHDGRYEAEGWRVRKDGTKFCALVVIDPIRDNSGQLIGFAKVTRDITDRATAQRELQETQAQLAAAQKMEAVGQLSGGIAHDFNNLMMIVLGNLENAERQIKASSSSIPNLQRYLSHATRGAQRAAALTSRLLAFSRRQPLDPKPIEVGKFLVGAGEFLQRSLGETVVVETVGAAGLWQIEADANHLESALVNLAINSRDAMPNGGKVTLEATNTFVDQEYCRQNPEMVPGQYVAIAVSDTGSGMSNDVMSRAFEPFFTTKEIGQGTGLGLSQVYGFVKQSHGHIKIYSEVGEGTTIKIYLPRRASSESINETVDICEPMQGEIGETILVVEDDTDLREYVTEVLQSLGYRTLSAANGEAAVPLLARELTRIDLLLTDVVMPGMNGRELAQVAGELRPGLKVLYMTGYSRNAIVHQGRLKEGVHLVEKPVSQAQLASRVRDLLDAG
jgi:PAS domain S-box-containing protein